MISIFLTAVTQTSFFTFCIAMESTPSAAAPPGSKALPSSAAPSTEPEAPLSTAAPAPAPSWQVESVNNSTEVWVVGHHCHHHDLVLRVRVVDSHDDAVSQQQQQLLKQHFAQHKCGTSCHAFPVCDTSSCTYCATSSVASGTAAPCCHAHVVWPHAQMVKPPVTQQALT